MTDQHLIPPDFNAGEDAELNSELLATIHILKRWTAPEPSADATAHLIQGLQAELHETLAAFPLVSKSEGEPARVKVNLSVGQAARSVGEWNPSNNWPPLLLLRAQLRVVQGEIWIASALIMLLGVVVALVTARLPGEAADLPLILIAPVVAAAGLAFLYGTDADPVMEIEHATPVSWSLLMLTRLALVFGFDFALGLAGSVILTLIHPSLSLWPLVGAWLAPMSFLSAFAFLISVLFVDPLVGTIVSFGLWIMQAFLRFWNVTLSFQTINLPNLLSEEARPWLLALAIPLFALSLWLSDHRDSFIRRSS